MGNNIKKDLESSITRKKALKQLREAGHFPYVIQGVAGSEGVPDLLILAPDKTTIYTLELKYKGKLSPVQKLFKLLTKSVWTVDFDVFANEIVVDIGLHDRVFLSTFLKEELWKHKEIKNKNEKFK